MEADYGYYIRYLPFSQQTQFRYQAKGKSSVEAVTVPSTFPQQVIIFRDCLRVNIYGVPIFSPHTNRYVHILHIERSWAKTRPPEVYS